MPATMTADSLAEAAQNLPMPELEALVQRLDAIRVQRRVPTLSRSETELLQRIESAIPLDSLLRRKSLRALAQGREFTDAEREEFSQLTDEIEIAEAARIDMLSELAALRGVSLPELARQLGHFPRP